MLLCEAPDLVAFANVELHDTLLALVEYRSGHGQPLISVILLPQEASQLLEGGALVRVGRVNVAAL